VGIYNQMERLQILNRVKSGIALAKKKAFIVDARREVLWIRKSSYRSTGRSLLISRMGFLPVNALQFIAYRSIPS